MNRAPPSTVAGAYSLTDVPHVGAHRVTERRRRLVVKSVLPLDVDLDVDTIPRTLPRRRGGAVALHGQTEEGPHLFRTNTWDGNGFYITVFTYIT